MIQTMVTSAGEELQDLISEMDLNYLDKIDALCTKSAKLIPQAADDYFSNYCRTLIELTELHVRYSRISLVPYLLELMEKEEVGHDCRSCSSSCTIRHTAQVEGILASHSHIKASLGLLRAITPPDLKESNELNNVVQSLAKTLSAMVSTEEQRMIPLILQVQKAIHAHG